jgi:hypothetical protein
MKVFEYIVIYNNTNKKESKILVPTKTILASDLQKANMLAARDIPPVYLSKLENIEVVVRPF